MVCGTCTFVAVAALAVCAAPAHAQLEPTLEAVRAQVRAAAGVRPANERIAVAVTRNGDLGTELRSRSGDDYRSDWAFGPFRNASGSIGGVTWEQNENGETIPDASDVAEPADEATVTKLTHEHDPADLYVISTLTVLGNGTKQYVDPATWRIVRSDAISPTGIRTTTFDDFRTTAGYTRAWHIAIGDGHEENDSTYTITNIDTSAISRTQLAVPASNRALVVFPRENGGFAAGAYGRSRREILRWTPGQLVPSLLPTTFRRRYPYAVVNADAGLDRERTLQGVGGRFDVKVLKIAELELGGMRFTDYDANLGRPRYRSSV
jgi:hypothetical protein